MDQANLFYQGKTAFDFNSGFQISGVETNSPDLVDQIDVISDAMDKGTAIGYEHGPSVQAGLLTSQGIIESMFQDIITNGTDVKKAAKKAENQLNDLFSTVQ